MSSSHRLVDRRRRPARRWQTAGRQGFRGSAGAPLTLVWFLPVQEVLGVRLPLVRRPLAARAPGLPSTTEPRSTTCCVRTVPVEDVAADNSLDGYSAGTCREIRRSPGPWCGSIVTATERATGRTPRGP